MTTARTSVCLIASGLLCSGCSDESTSRSTDQSAKPDTTPQSSPWFEDVSDSSGIDFTWKSGHDEERFLMPEITGGGAALLDVDSDGDLDVYLVQGGEIQTAKSTGTQEDWSNRLYRNDGNWTFTDITAGSGADDRQYGQGVATGDFDNDGDTDLYVTNVGPNVLLRNEGQGRFADVSQASGTAHKGWGASAAFFDFDNDGDLDLYVTNYIAWSLNLVCLSPTGPDYCAPTNYLAPAQDVLYENLGNGRFRDATVTSGIDVKMGNGLGIACIDFDQDGWTDVFVANDGTQDLLWHNQGDGTFQEIGLLAGCALDDEGKPKAGMGVATTDIDDDGDLDLLVCNLIGESDSYFLNHGDYFVDNTAQAGFKTTTKIFTRFGLGWMDFNHDGSIDIFEANGGVLRAPVTDGLDPYAQDNVLLRGAPSGKFTEVLPRGGVALPITLTSRGAAFGDINGDGAIDIVIVNRDAPATILRNIAKKDGHWVLLRVIDKHGRDAIGATIGAQVGERTLTRPVITAYSYFAANDPRVHLGLGEVETIDALEVRWVDGSTETFGPLKADQMHVITQGQGR